MDGFVAPVPRRRLALPRRSLRSAADERLVAQTRGTDGRAARAAFEVLFDRHNRGVLAFCRHMLGSLEEAEDAVQHTFSAAYTALLRDDREIALRAWLYAIARNRCLSMLAARREQVALDDVDGLLPSTAGLALEVERRSDLRELLADMQRLPDDQRAALVLAELEAHTHKEIAEILGVPVAKVKALVFQARETLMIRRQARETDCTQIREQLSVLRGGALRRRELRRHVDSCEGCGMFEAELRRQRAGMAILLPVAPTLALKNGTLAATFGVTTTSTAAGIGTISAGGAVAGIAVGTKAIATKALAVLALAGSAGGGGYVTVSEVRDARAATRAEAEFQRGTGAGAGAAKAAPAASALRSPATASPGSTASPGTADSAAASSSGGGGVSGPERAGDRSGGRSDGAPGNSVAARSDLAAAAGAGRDGVDKKRSVARRSAAGSRRAGSKTSAERAATKGTQREAQRDALAARRARPLQEALRGRKADAARGAQQKPVSPPQTTAPPSPQRPERPLEAAPSAAAR